jgi:hypothetical protein
VVVVLLIVGVVGALTIDCCLLLAFTLLVR